MRKFLVGFTIAGLCSSAMAQQNNWCSSMDALRAKIATDAVAQKQYDDYVDYSKQLEANYKLHGSSNRAVSDTTYVPVVFHIIHNGDAVGTNENISDAQVFSQIDAMNKYFSLQNDNAATIPAEFKPLAAATTIRFCMATLDPNGNPTKGITRNNLGQAGWDQNDIESTVKPSTIWNHNKYLNIWSVNAAGTMLSSGTLAYAQFPFAGAANTDGLVSRYDVIGAGSAFNLVATYTKGKTLAHEAGHWFGLFHIWGDDNGKCAGQPGAGSDYISDTPDQGDQYFGFPSYPQMSCGTSNMFMNFMDYANDDCSSMFTIEQVAKMQATVDGSRSGLKTAATNCYRNTDLAIEKALQPTANVCISTFSPLLQIRNKGLNDVNIATIQYAVDGVYSSYTWTGTIPALTVDYIKLPAITGVADGSHTFNAFFTDVNTLGSDDAIQNDSVQLAFNVADQGAGFPSPYTEDFESGIFPPSDWTIDNPNNDVVTWQSKNGLGAYGTSNTCIWIDNSKFATNPTSANARKDAFLLQDLDFSAQTAPYLKFDYAYAVRVLRGDTLQISYSLDCGTTWNVAWRNGAIPLSTSGNDSIVPFVPADNEWKTINVPLQYLAGQQKVKIKFENLTGWGNALYVDNINVGQSNVGIADKPVKVNVSVFPNPANDLVTVKLQDNHSFESIQLVDELGRVVKTQTIIDPISFVNVSGLAEGVYTVNLISVKARQTEKLVIAR